MTGSKALLPTALWAAVIVAAAPPARAQCRLCDTPTVERVQSAGGSTISLQVEAALDFDRLVMINPGDGSATLHPDGSRQVSGTITAISGRAMVGQARVRGEAGRPVRIGLPDRIELFSLSGNRILIEDISSDLPAIPRLDPAGTLTFRFGGQLRVSGDADGEYRGDIPITVEYL